MIEGGGAQDRKTNGFRPQSGRRRGEQLTHQPIQTIGSEHIDPRVSQVNKVLPVRHFGSRHSAKFLAPMGGLGKPVEIRYVQRYSPCMDEQSTPTPTLNKRK